MAVHAHPDDEAIGTGGILARYAAEGVRTVLVTCTNGELGDAPGGVKPGEPGHDERVVVAAAAAGARGQLRGPRRVHLELLGYHDSGMEGWPQNDAPGSFWRTPVDEAAGRLAELMRRYRAPGGRDLRRERLLRAPRPHSGQPGHPRRPGRVRDPGQAVLHGRAALDDARLPRDHGRSRRRAARPRWRRTPTSAPPTSSSRPRSTAAPWRDASTRRSAAHASQSENIFFLQMGEELFSTIMGSESFVRAVDRTNAPVPEVDLFAGLR